jgi:hypothetical protein
MYMEFWWRDFGERPLEDQEGHGRKTECVMGKYRIFG